MKLERTTTAYGHTFSLNVAVEHGTDWTGKAPAYVHFCRIDLGDDHDSAMSKAVTIKEAMGSAYKFTLSAVPKVASYSQDI